MTNEVGEGVGTVFPACGMRDWSHCGGFHNNYPPTHSAVTFVSVLLTVLWISEFGEKGCNDGENLCKTGYENFTL